MNKKQDELIERLFKTMYNRLLDYAANALKDNALAEEAVQDTFRIACAKVGDLITSDNPHGWLMNTLKNAIRNIRKSRARNNKLQLLLLTKLTQEGGQLIAEDDYAALEADMEYMQAIGAKNHNLIKKVVLQGYTIVEVSEELGISAEACKKRVQRAKAMLKEYLEKDLK